MHWVVFSSWHKTFRTVQKCKILRESTNKTEAEIGVIVCVCENCVTSCMSGRDIDAYMFILIFTPYCELSLCVPLSFYFRTTSLVATLQRSHLLSILIPNFCIHFNNIVAFHFIITYYGDLCEQDSCNSAIITQKLFSSNRIKYSTRVQVSSIADHPLHWSSNLEAHIWTLNINLEAHIWTLNTYWRYTNIVCMYIPGWLSRLVAQCTTQLRYLLRHYPTLERRICFIMQLVISQCP